MARGTFSTSNYLVTGSAPVSSYPYSMGCWVRTSQNTANETIICISDAAGDIDYMRIYAAGATAGDPIAYQLRRSGSTTVTTGNGFSLNTWHYVLVTSAANNDHTVWLDGDVANKGTSSSTRNFASGADNFGIGALTRLTVAVPLTGFVSDAAVWNAVLTDADAVALANRTSPRRVKPQSLIGYWPCGGMETAASTGNEPDVWGGNTATETGVVGETGSIGLIYPSSPIVVTSTVETAGRINKLVGPGGLIGPGGGMIGV